MAYNTEPKRAFFCSYCGAPIQTDVNFCSKCGKPTGISSKTHRKCKAPVIAISIIASLLIIVTAVILFHPTSIGIANMMVSEERHLQSKTISPSGGEIEIDDTGTALDGMVLTVPDGAYDTSEKFEIGMSQINSWSQMKLGELFHPASPLIHIDNGGGFANEPMTVKIPIQKTDDEFAMAFYYDTVTGELEGIPTVELENDHITIVTCHFCDIVVTKEKLERITGTELNPDFEIDSGFDPGFDSFRFANHGSVICPSGHCAGESIGAMYYYLNHGRIGWDKNLYGMFDNNGRGDTPFLEWDDANAIRLCSVLQTYYKTKWPTVTKFAGDPYIQCAYAIAETHQPQYFSLGGHAVIAYKVTTDGLWIADPNYPGEEREIKYVNGKLNSYFSGSNYEEATTNSREYKNFGYYGLFSLINESDVKAAWEKLRNGQDPGAGVFPADLQFSATVGKEQGADILVNVPLTDGMAVTNTQLSEAGQGGFLVYTTLSSDDEVIFYDGETKLEVCEYSQSEFPFHIYELQQGKNDLGMLYAHKVDGKYRYINFYRFTVYLQDELTMSVSPESATVFPGDPIPFTVTAAGAPSDAVYAWDFGDGVYDETSETLYNYAYDEEGTYDGKVTLYSASSPDTPLAEGYFYVCVLETEDFTSPPETSMPTPEVQPTDAILYGKWYGAFQDTEYIFEFFGDGTATVNNVTDSIIAKATYTTANLEGANFAVTLYVYDVNGQTVNEDNEMELYYNAEGGTGNLYYSDPSGIHIELHK